MWTAILIRKILKIEKTGVNLSLIVENEVQVLPHTKIPIPNEGVWILCKRRNIYQ